MLNFLSKNFVPVYTPTAGQVFNTGFFFLHLTFIDLTGEKTEFHFLNSYFLYAIRHPLFFI